MSCFLLKSGPGRISLSPLAGAEDTIACQRGLARKPILQESWRAHPDRAIISACFNMVSVAQLVELWIVAPAVAGSNPVAHPTPLHLFSIT
jgi:hypothetical protein